MLLLQLIPHKYINLIDLTIEELEILKHHQTSTNQTNIENQSKKLCIPLRLSNTSTQPNFLIKTKTIINTLKAAQQSLIATINVIVKCV